MKEIKTDQRSKYTQMIIKKCLLTLMKEKPLNKITVAELCAAAEINRGTFYNHFNDVFDVYGRIENDFYTEITSKLDTIKSYAIEKSFYREIVLLFYRNVDFCALILGGKSDFLQRVLDYVHDKFIMELSSQYKKIPLSVLESLFLFNTGGIVGIVTDWVQKDMKRPPEEIASLIDEFSTVATAGLVKKYDLPTR